MKIDRTGCHRIVFVTENFVFKIPNFLDGFKFFIKGIRANKKEKKIYNKSKFKNIICPIVFYIPFGLLVVMPKVRVMIDEEFLSLNEKWLNNFLVQDYQKLDVEIKANSFGYLNDKIVIIDYAGLNP